MSMMNYSPMDIDGFEPRFGLGLAPADFFSDRIVPRMGLDHLMTGYRRPWQIARDAARELSKAQKDLHFGKDGFQACVDVHHFQPSEITVKTLDNLIVIEGKHEERDDNHGSISRHFVRKYQLPKEYDMNAVHTTLSSDGVLTIKAPPPAIGDRQEKHIPITHTNLPARLHVKDHGKDHAKSPQVQTNNHVK